MVVVVINCKICLKTRNDGKVIDYKDENEFMKHLQSIHFFEVGHLLGTKEHYIEKYAKASKQIAK